MPPRPARPASPRSAPSDAVHLLTAGFWIGGLAVLVVLFRRKEPNILLALSLFSDWAMIAVLLLVMTGLINAASIILGGQIMDMSTARSIWRCWAPSWRWWRPC